MRGQAVGSVQESSHRGHRHPPEAVDHRGLRLDEARDGAEAAGFGVDDHNASNDVKSIRMRSNRTVCFQKTGWTSSDRKTIGFGAVQTGAPCPEADDGTIPWPKMPDLVWKTWKTAHKEVVDLDIVPEDRVGAEAAEAAGRPGRGPRRRRRSAAAAAVWGGPGWRRLRPVRRSRRRP
ncbi:hypothetical protein ACTWJ9_06045 [Streptomyces sp. GDS52]|uniref:hypothetical protein n=1 Tax=Streptomyces sp. GDS52 TaxID=3406419 RepID=UPI003FD56E5D